MPKLLIVDDELDVREFAKNFFSRRNIECFTAEGGTTAISLFKEHKPNLILLDVVMDDMNGVEVLDEIKKIDKDARVIMVTGSDEEEIIEKTKELGAIGYIHKPLVLEELEQVVLKEIK